MRPSRVLLAAACGVLASTFVFAKTAQQAHRRTHNPAAKPPAKPAATESNQPQVYTDAIRENNIGIALMERHAFTDALANFQRACVMNPESDIGCLNMGIALLNAKAYDDARKILSKSAERDPHNPWAWFNLALLERDSDNPDAAQADFEKVAALDPDDPDTQYFLGSLAEQSQRYEDAAGYFQRAVSFDPSNVSAGYALADAEQRLGALTDAQMAAARADQFSTSRFVRPIRFDYGEQGKYSHAEEMNPPPQNAPSAIPVHFENVTSLSGLPWRFPEGPAAKTRSRARALIGPVAANSPSVQKLAQFLGSGACILDYDGDGKPDILLVNADGKGNAGLFKNTGRGTFVDVTKAAKLQFSGSGTGCAVGDYDNDGHPDLAISSGNGITLFHNQGNGTFADVTDSAGFRIDGLVLGLSFVDYDGDGNLDLYATRFNDFPFDHSNQPFVFPDGAEPAGNVLWRNLGNGRFTALTKEFGLAGSAASVDALVTDINNDRAPDFILTGWRKFPTLLLDARDGTFRAADPWAISMPGPTAGAIAFDFNQDGWMDLAFTHWCPPGLSVWRNAEGASFERMPIVGPGWMRGWGIASIDYDNDGWTDLVAVGETFSGEGRLALFRNEGAGGFRDVTHETGLDKIVLRDPRSVIALDYDGDGATDLLITQNHLPPVLLKNVGGDKNNWLQLALAGAPDNRSGIGARIEIFAGAERETVHLGAGAGYLGQGPGQVAVGLGAEGDADLVRIVWPSGAEQDEVRVPGGRHTIQEKQNP